MKRESDCLRKKQKQKRIMEDAGGWKGKISLWSESEARPCTECGKKFWSWKALFGHMRCHPERHWRGINPPPNVVRRQQQQQQMSQEDHEVAACLLLLANSNAKASCNKLCHWDSSSSSNSLSVLALDLRFPL